jgi:hypothetical protein
VKETVLQFCPSSSSGRYVGIWGLIPGLRVLIAPETRQTRAVGMVWLPALSPAFGFCRFISHCPGFEDIVYR